MPCFPGSSSKYAEKGGDRPLHPMDSLQSIQVDDLGKSLWIQKHKLTSDSFTSSAMLSELCNIFRKVLSYWTAFYL